MSKKPASKSIVANFAFSAADDGASTPPPVQPFARKYSRSLLTQLTSISIAIPHPQEGRFAIVTDVGSGMRWTRGALLTRAHPCGRRSRVVLTPQWLASSW